MRLPTSSHGNALIQGPHKSQVARTAQRKSNEQAKQNESQIQHTAGETATRLKRRHKMASVSVSRLAKCLARPTGPDVRLEYGEVLNMQKIHILAVRIMLSALTGRIRLTAALRTPLTGRKVTALRASHEDKMPIRCSRNCEGLRANL